MSTAPATAQLLITAGILVWAVITDTKTHKIKNAAVLTGIIAGLLLHLPHASPAVKGMLFPLTLVVFHILGMMGAGDIKLFCALGALLGWPEIFNIMLYGFVFAGLFIALHALANRRFLRMLAEILSDMTAIFIARKATGKDNTGMRIPMAGMIALATVFVTTARITGLTGLLFL